MKISTNGFRTAIIQQNKKIPEICNKITGRKEKEKYPKNEIKVTYYSQLNKFHVQLINSKFEILQQTK